jgi:hypothetical protein
VTTTDALFAGKVQRKVSNGVARLAAAGSSLDRHKIATILAISAIDYRSRRNARRDPGTRSELRIPAPQLKRE